MISMPTFNSNVKLKKRFIFVVQCNVPQSFFGPRRLQEWSTHPARVTVLMVSRSAVVVLSMTLRVSGDCAIATVPGK